MCDPPGAMSVGGMGLRHFRFRREHLFTSCLRTRQSTRLLFITMGDSIEVKELLELVFLKYNLNITLKQPQEQLIAASMQKQHAFGFLPTGYGKTLTFLLPPLLLDEADPENAPHVVLVVSPLRALIADQVAHCQKTGIKCVALVEKKDMSPEDIERVRTGKVNVIFASPEALQTSNWVSCMRKYAKRVCLIALDEVHCLSEWGSDFRPEYLHVSELRSIFTRSPFLCLSATVDDETLVCIQDILQLQMDEVQVVALPPDRPNIYLEIIHRRRYDFEEELKFLVDGVREEGVQYPKTVVYCNSIMTVYDIFVFLVDNLGTDAYTVSGSKDHTVRLISMFHAEIGKDLRDFTLDIFPKSRSSIRILVSTIAFGMGVNVPDIRNVIHWGKAKSVLSYWQEVGRAGRDGAPAKATWFPKGVGNKDRELFVKLKTDPSICIRAHILDHFRLHGIPLHANSLASTSSDTCKCSCCSHCKPVCEKHRPLESE